MTFDEQKLQEAGNKIFTRIINELELASLDDLLACAEFLFPKNDIDVWNLKVRLEVELANDNPKPPREPHPWLTKTQS